MRRALEGNQGDCVAADGHHDLAEILVVVQHAAEERSVDLNPRYREMCRNKRLRVRPFSHRREKVAAKRPDEGHDRYPERLHKANGLISMR